jgi:hypothetical protein
MPFLASPSGAQEPQPEPVGILTLSESSPGSYQLEFNSFQDRSPYVVTYHTFAIGTDQGFGSELEEQSEPDFVLPLRLPLDGMREEGCYRVAFSVTPAEEISGRPVDPFLGEGAGISTRACVDAAGNTTFPAHDDVVTPPPPPPSNVRVVPHADGWKVEWRDNSTDEIAFDVGLIFLDRPWADGGSALSGLELPEVPANQTAAYALGTGQFFVPDEPAVATCGYAMVLVFAIGPDSPSIWPGNTTVPACFGGGTLSFPEAGDGLSRDDNYRRQAMFVLSSGIALALSGLWLRRRADKLTGWPAAASVVRRRLDRRRQQRPPDPECDVQHAQRPRQHRQRQRHVAPPQDPHREEQPQERAHCADDHPGGP